MKREIQEKYEIIISPKDRHDCGKCTYKSKRLIETNNDIIFREWYCLLFSKTLCCWCVGGPEKKPERSHECLKLTDNFKKIPELGEYDE